MQELNFSELSKAVSAATQTRRIAAAAHEWRVKEKLKREYLRNPKKVEARVKANLDRMERTQVME